MDTNKFKCEEAETEVLGAIFLDNTIMKNIVDILSPEDFYNSANGIIYSAMKQLYINNSSIDATTVYNELGIRASDVGGITYIASLSACCPSAQNVSNHCKIVKEKSQNRQIYKILRGSIKDMENTDIKSEMLIDKLQDNFSDLGCFGSTKENVMSDIMIDYLSSLEERYNNGGRIYGYTTGFQKIDNFLGGLKKQDFIILAGRPSMGKSAAALNMATNMAINNGHKIAFFHLEMSKFSTVERIVANVAEIPMNKLKKADLSDEEWESVVEKSNKIASSSLSLYDEIYNLTDIRAECKRLKLQNGLDVVFIDYLQLIDHKSGSENRNENIASISRSLKLLAKELEITVIALSQLSRAPEARANHRPQLSDLRDSGSLEQDADLVMFLYRDEYYNGESEDKGIMEFIIAKHRNGETGTIKAKWESQYQRIIA